MKIIIIVTVLILLLGGGLVGAAMVVPDLVRPIAEPLGLVEPKTAEQLAEEEANRVVPIAQYPMDIISIPIIEDGRPAAFLILEMTLVVEQGEGQIYVQRNIPRIKDAIIRYILSLSAIDDRPAMTNLDFLQDRLIRIINLTVGYEAVRDIYFVNVFERPL